MCEFLPTMLFYVVSTVSRITNMWSHKEWRDKTIDFNSLSKLLLGASSYTCRKFHGQWAETVDEAADDTSWYIFITFSHLDVTNHCYPTIIPFWNQEPNVDWLREVLLFRNFLLPFHSQTWESSYGKTEKTHHAGDHLRQENYPAMNPEGAI